MSIDRIGAYEESSGGHVEEEEEERLSEDGEEQTGLDEVEGRRYRLG